MEKEFIPYEQALELKELGFDEPCFGLYHNDKTFYLTQCKSHEQYHGQICTAPTFSQCFRFFREKYGLYSWITMELGATLTFCWIVTGENKGTEHKAFFKSYEEAELACLKKLIEIVKNNNK